MANYQFGDNSYHYLELMTKLCKENGIELILIKSPSVYPYWYEEWDEQMVQYAKEHELTYINFLKLADEIGIDYGKIPTMVAYISIYLVLKNLVCISGKY